MSPPRTSPLKAGFTLVEVIISASLGAVLMVGLWTVFDIFSALQERAATQSARAQLTRGLYHQLQDDLYRVEPPAVGVLHTHSDRALMPVDTRISTDGQGLTDDFASLGSSEMAADQAAEQIAFLGSRSWLIMDLPQSSHDTEPETDDFAAQMTDSPASVLPSRRVIYHFVAPEFAILNDSIDDGLTRWELSNPPTHIRELIEELDRGEWGTPDSIAWRSTDFPTPILDVGEQARRNSSQALVARENVPEVKRFLFRYFDGVNWRTTWDSRRDGSLPLAVECLLVWRDDSENPTVLPSAVPPSAGNLAPAEIREELEEMSLSNVWENLGQQDYSATSVRTPRGFGRYVLCLPAGLPRQRHVFDTPAASLGQR